MTGPIFDTHAHYSAHAFDADRFALLDSLPGKGVVKAGNCADLNLFDENMNLVHVFAKGRQMMRNGEIIVKGTFEE